MATPGVNQPKEQTGSYFSSDKSDYMNGKTHRVKRWEVFFPHVFTSVYPHKEASSVTFPDVSIPVTTLSHITHNKEARQIMKDKREGGETTFVFRPQKKMGKAYVWDGYPIGESFRADFLPPQVPQVDLDPENQNYTYISREESVMPNGYYSWWGTVAPQGTLKDVELINSDRPSYLKNTPSSRYGNNEFSGELSQLLKAYQEHNDDPNNPESPNNVYMLLGGTLRYRREICCVIIICSEEHRKKELKDYKPIPPMNPPTKDPVLIVNLTDDEGCINWAASPLQFYPVQIDIKKSWANLAFAFYFASNKEFIVKGLTYNEIHHADCVKKKQPSDGDKLVCPNEIF